MKKIIYILAKGFFYAFAVFFVFIFVFSILAFAEHQLGWNVPYVNITEEPTHSYANINLPLLDMHVGFIFKLAVVFAMWIGIVFYVIYFYALKEFFKVFIEEEVFNAKSLERLKIFFIINLIPVGFAFGLSMYQIVKNGSFKFEEDQGIAIFHLCIAFLAYLYMDIIRKGNLIQEENDLTI
ncbi:MAG: DUF2975 domain-containing protein [Winogradskyella sp.]|uniref:DUF2975 domain-containing protein n=1 Tax=Winogradskyella sp. TaxID=1883156 RepID=UPI00385E035D